MAEQPRQWRSARGVLAYFLLVFLFMTLGEALLRTIGSTYDTKQFAQLQGLIDRAFNLTHTVDEVGHELFSLLLAFIFSLPIGWVYTLTKRDDETFDPGLVHTIIALAMAVTGVMVVIGSELSRAFSLAGVVAAVRFRNSLADTKDAVYVFTAVAVGMACGTRGYHLAVWLSLVMSVALFVLWVTRFGAMFRGERPAPAEPARGKKKGRKDAEAPVEAALAELDEAARERLAASLEAQLQLAQAARLREDKKGKRPNAAVLIEATEVVPAETHAEAVLDAAGGDWRLSRVAALPEGGFRLEYLGRLPKGEGAGPLLAALSSHAPISLKGIEFRSLKGMGDAVRTVLPFPARGEVADPTPLAPTYVVVEPDEPISRAAGGRNGDLDAHRVSES